MENNNRITLITKIYLSLFVLLPILNQYSLGPLTFIQIYTIFGVVIWFAQSEKHAISKEMCIYALYVVLISILALFFNKEDSFLGLLLRLSNFLLSLINFYIVFRNLSNFEFIYRFYTKIVTIITALFLAQYILYVFFNTPTMLLIPGTTLNYNDGLSSTEFMMETIGRIAEGYYYRPCSVFIEPVYYSIYVIPWLVIKVFKYGIDSPKALISSMIVTASMMLTTSSMGIIASIIIWGIYLVLPFILKEKKLSIYSLLFFPAIILAAFWLFNQAGIRTSIFIKLNSITNFSSASSFSWRVLRGFECFKNMGLYQQIFGAGYGSLSTYFSQIHLVTRYDGHLSRIDYMNGISYMMCSIGVVGSMLYFMLLGRTFKSVKKSTVFVVMFIMLILITITSEAYDNWMYYLFLDILIMLDKEHELQLQKLEA